MNRLVWLLLLYTFFSSSLLAQPLPKEAVPEPLKPWIGWVTQDNPEQACPFFFNSFEQKRCSWPTVIMLALSTTNGQFSTRWQVYKEDWISLPGDNRNWPQNISVNNQTALVLDRNGSPSIKLPVGVYEITGDWAWTAIPDNLKIPEDTGLINLSINGAGIATPTIRDGLLWLKESEIGQKKPENMQNSLDIQVFRRISDDVPLQVLTRLVLEVSGEQRELELAKSLLNGFVPLSLQSMLPARLEADGQLLLQVRPGRWQIDLLSRAVNEINNLPLPSVAKDWPASEVWVFDARPDLRVVEIGQLDSIDASQTNVPEEWRQLPAYRINQGQAMVLKVLRRGDPEPEPNQLSINRKLWLDFDGSGYTANDTITGKMTRGWRLNALPQTHTGKVTLDGDNQLITRQINNDKQGVEVRKGLITLDADSRLVGDIGQLSAVGWEQDFQHVSAELNLPPGWRLLAADGVDNVPDSWFSQWTLFDLFLVLCAALAIGRLWNVYWGAFALLTLVMIWHELGAPHFIWLNILAATALISVLPPGKFLSLMGSYRNICWVTLALIALPFMVNQVRMGIYPQLEKPYQTINEPQYPASVPSPVQTQMMAMGRADMPDSSVKAKRGYGLGYAAKAMIDTEQNNEVRLEQIDPKAKVQTGPGLPQWQWNKVFLSWSGPVDAGQTLHLWYLSPPLTQLLNGLRVVFIVVLALLMFGVVDKFTPCWPYFKVRQSAWLWLAMLPLLALPPRDVFADYPSDAMLGELKNRLQEIEQPDCLPACADISQMTLAITDKTTNITLQINVQESVAIPLPSDYSQWFPSQVLDNGTLATALYRDNNGLWIHLDAGQHHVLLRGATPLLEKFSLPLPLKPKYVRIEKSGWDVFGVQDSGVPDGQLQFTRTNVIEDKTLPSLERDTLPAFMQVERVLSLGLDWRVTTRITRLSLGDEAVLLNVPLLAGEAVVSAGVRVKDGKVEVNMPSASQDAVMEWQSSLEKRPQIELVAPQTEQWVEIWKADISPIWHLETSGIAMIHLNNEAQWLPEWRPWPGEKITLQISRPEAIAGQTLTIDNSSLTVKLGQRLRDAQLKFTLRSSQGGQHTITLPEQASLQSVLIDAQSQPIRQQGNKLTLPVNPGKQEVSVSWQEILPITVFTSTPSVDMGLASVNTKLNISLGNDRWVLFTLGPQLGPAVLFWSVLVVIFMLSLGLGKIPLTPLKTLHWFLLLIGLSQIAMIPASIVILWLVLLGWRARQKHVEARYFNETQVVIAGLTVVSLAVLFYAVAQGLLSSPDMRVTGNLSSAFNLHWYQDRSGSTLPTATLISVPVLVYRLLMLGWSLWLAVALLNWLKWGWECYSCDGLWRKKMANKAAENVQTPPNMV
jgi:hypothetical protein